MTREHKLALILGFAVLLVVGILVSDHFSTARSAVIGAEIATGRPGAESVMQDPLPGAGAPVQLAGLVGLGSAGDGPGGYVGGAINGTPLPDPEPLPAAAAIGPSLAEFVAGPSEGFGTTQIVMGGRVDALGRDEEGQIPEGFERLGSGRGALGVATSLAEKPAVVTQGASEKAPAQESGPPARPGLPVSTGALREHAVGKDDSMWGIAQRFYGEGALHAKLTQYNQGRVGKDGVLRRGVTLRIPPRDVLLGQAVLASDAPVVRPTQGQARAVQDRAESKPAVGAGGEASGRVYVVRRGDTLGAISRALLGTSKRYREIYELNRGVVPDPDNLVAGVSLKIPAR